MNYANEKGIVMSAEDKEITKAIFPPMPIKPDLNARMDFVGTLPVLLQLVNKIIEMQYDVRPDNITLTEKNKGGEYSSSAFTITTIMEILTDAEYAIDGYLTESSFTFKGAPFWFIKEMFSYATAATPIDVENATNKPFMEMVEKDHWLVDVIRDPDAGTDFLTEYRPFALTPKGESKGLNLDSVDKVRYQAFMTKYMELDCNQNIFQSAEVTQRERTFLIQRYAWFLLALLEKTFKIEFIEQT